MQRGGDLRESTVGRQLMKDARALAPEFSRDYLIKYNAEDPYDCKQWVIHSRSAAYNDGWIEFDGPVSENCFQFSIQGDRWLSYEELYRSIMMRLDSYMVQE